jgi:hypothetical protein
VFIMIDPSSDIRVELQRQFAAEADIELARRSRSGTLAYFLLFLVLTLTTPFRHDHPVLVWVLGTLLLAIGLIRLVMSVRLRQSPAPPKGWRRSFGIGIYACSLLWGGSCGLMLALYGAN